MSLRPGYSWSATTYGGDKNTQLRNQMTRLFRCQVELIYEEDSDSE